MLVTEIALSWYQEVKLGAGIIGLGVSFPGMLYPCRKVVVHPLVSLGCNILFV